MASILALTPKNPVENPGQLVHMVVPVDPACKHQRDKLSGRIQASHPDIAEILKTFCRSCFGTLRDLVRSLLAAKGAALAALSLVLTFVLCGVLAVVYLALWMWFYPPSFAW